MTDTKTIRDKYFANEIFRIGEIVEDISTGEQMKILDRGSNYVTVATENNVTKKWLNEVTELPVKTETVPKIIPEFEILESGQIKLFGYETKNFDTDLSEFVLEQFSEFEDLYSKHQIIKCLDMAMFEDNIDDSYALLQKVEKFYSVHNIDTPLIVEAMKTDIERKRIADIIAAVAGIKPQKSNYDTIVASIKALRVKYQLKKQWEVLWPFFKIAQDAGLMGIMANMPYNFDKTSSRKLGEDTEESTDDIIISVMEENIDMLVDDLEYEDIELTFLEEEFTNELLCETLSIEARNKLSRKLKQHSPLLAVKRELAMARAVSSSILLKRAARLAETIIKRRMFHKAPADMSRQEKERFESGISKRRALISRLAQKLVPKVRMLQSARLHHNNTSPTPATPAVVGHDAS